MNDIMDMARELGNKINETELSARLEAARAAFDNDMDARETLFDYNKKRRRVEALMDGGKAGTEEFKAANAEFGTAAKRLSENSVVKELVDCEQKFSYFLNQVLNIVKATVLGEDACTGDCGSCGGCH